MEKDQAQEIGGNKAEWMNLHDECAKTEILCYTAPSSVFELLLLPACPCFCRQGTDSDKGGFPLSHNFYVRTHLNFKGVNKIETMYESQA